MATALEQQDIRKLIIRSATMALEHYGDLERTDTGEALPAEQKADIIRANEDEWIERVCLSLMH
jgi:hypothetical protein